MNLRNKGPHNAGSGDFFVAILIKLDPYDLVLLRMPYFRSKSFLRKKYSHCFSGLDNLFRFSKISYLYRLFPYLLFYYCISDLLSPLLFAF